MPEQNGKIAFDPEKIFDQHETEDIEGMSSPMKDFYRGKTIFLTGGTGFIGLIMLEKLLRCEVKEVFLFVRPKKGKTPEERVNAIFDEPIYVRLRKKKDYYMSKINIVEGNLAHPTLGIDPLVKFKVIQDTEIFIHAAADVRFDETLKEAVETNVRGTREMLKLAEQMSRLVSFMYMSTAYANCPQRKIEEKFYETPVDPEIMIKFSENIAPETADDINILTDRIVEPWPNTYAYTKALAEELMRIYSKKLPIVVVRPSIIMMTYSDPIPGWLNNVYGINGVFTGVGMGVLRIFYIDNRKKADIIPADIVVNSSLAVIWHSVTKGAIPLKETPDYTTGRDDTSAPVYNCVNNVDNPVTWGEVKKVSVPMAQKYATLSSLWIGIYNTTRFNWIYHILRMFYHVIPAFFFDFFLKLQGQKPRVVKIYKKIHRFAGAIAYFTNNEWAFETKNMRMVLNNMSRVDQKYFISDMKKLKWDDIFDIFGQGIRKYIVKEAPETLQRARDRYRKIQVLHYFLLFFIYSFLSWASYHILKFYGFIDLGYEYYSQVKEALIEE